MSIHCRDVTFLTSIIILLLDETFSTSISVYCRDVTFSTSMSIHCRDVTFSTSISIFLLDETFSTSISVYSRDVTFSTSMQKEVDRPTRLLQFVTFVDLPFSFRSLDLFVASLLFRQGTSFCVIRRK